MKPTLVKDRTHCPKGHDLGIHGYYFGSNQRCRACNRRAIRDEHSGLKNQTSGEGLSVSRLVAETSQAEHGLSDEIVVDTPAMSTFNAGRERKAADAGIMVPVHSRAECLTNNQGRNEMKSVNRFFQTAVTVCALTLVSVVAHAATINLKADLKASAEVPPKDSAGTGTLTATLNTETNEFTYHIEFSGLTGPVAAAHFHGPAAVGVNAKPQLPIKGTPITSPIDGKATLTSEQAKDLVDGKWYFNLHTASNPGGEIRGQVLKSE